jgi:hypothetical protein
MTGTVYNPRGVQFEDYTQCGSVLGVCGIHSVNQALDQHLTMPEEEEAAKHKATFLDELKEYWKQTESACVNLIPKTILF